MGFGNGATCLEEAVEDAGLVVDVGIGGVDILGSLLLAGEHASRETEDTSGDAVDGEHHTSAEAVVALLGVFLEDGEACLFEDGIAIAILACMLGKGAPLVETIAETKGFDDLVAETTGVEVA